MGCPLASQRHRVAPIVSGSRDHRGVLEEIPPNPTGCWLLVTSTSSYLLDFEGNTFTRFPGPDARRLEPQIERPLRGLLHARIGHQARIVSWGDYYPHIDTAQLVSISSLQGADLDLWRSRVAERQAERVELRRATRERFALRRSMRERHEQGNR